MNQRRTVRVRSLAHLRWGESLPLEVSVVGGEPDAGAFEVPGPKRIPARPHAELTTGPGGTLARILGPDGLPRPRAARVDDPGAIIDLPGPSLSLAARGDGGLWSLQRDGLHHISAEGKVVASLALTGVRLLGSIENGVWVLDLNRVWLVQGGGKVTGDHSWRDPFATIVSGDSLCRLEEAGVCCLDTAGRQTFKAMTTAPGAFERLVSIGEVFVLTSTPNTLRRYDRDGSAVELTILGAGRTRSGKPFLASSDDDAVILWVADAPARRLLPSKAGLPAEAAVLACDGDRVLMWAGDRAAWYAGEDVERSFPVTDESYRDQLFPHAWRVDRPYPFVASQDTGVLVSTSGPSGVAILGIV